MKILCVIQRYYPVIGGTEILAKKFMDYLSKNHEVTVVTTTAKDIEAFWNKKASKITDEDLEKYSVKRYDILTPNEIKFEDNLDHLSKLWGHPGPFSPKMWEELVFKKIDYDLIFAASFPYNHIMPAYVAAKKWKIPFVLWPAIHQEFPELFLVAPKITMLNNSDAIFVQTHSEKKILLDYEIDAKKISIISPFLASSDLENSNQSDFRKKYLQNKESKIVLFAGSKSYVKGVTHLIEAMKLVWEKEPDSYLVLIGPSTGEFEMFFEKLPNKTKQKILDLGVVNDNDKKNALAACDILALPSKSESFGLVYLEAWHFQKPVIGCNIPSTIELIDNGKNGVIVEFGNIKQLHTAIINLLKNPTKCDEMGSEGRKKVASYESEEILKMFEEKCVSVVNDFKNKKHE